MYATTHRLAREARDARRLVVNKRLATAEFRRRELAATMARIAQAARDKHEREAAILHDLENDVPGTLAYAYERNPFTGACTKIAQVTR